MPRRRAIVTGGAGFIGSHLCERLLTDGYEVLCVDNFSSGRPENVSGLGADRSFHLLRHDVTDRLQVPGRVDVVCHLASPASPVDYLKLPIQTLKAGSLGTLHTLGLAEAKGARYLLASTSEVYGDPLLHPQREDYAGNVNPVGPRAVYDEAKRFAETLTTAYRAAHDVDAVITRIFNTFGPRMRPYDGRVIPTFIRQALAGEPLTVTGDGTQTRSVCFVDDLIDGLVRLLHSGHAGPMNLGSPRETTMLELAGIICALCGSDSPITFVPRPPDDPRRRRPDITLARHVLGWRPLISLEDGLKKTIAWYLETSAVGGEGTGHA